MVHLRNVSVSIKTTNPPDISIQTWNLTVHLLTGMKMEMIILRDVIDKYSSKDKESNDENTIQINANANGMIYMNTINKDEVIKVNNELKSATTIIIAELFNANLLNINHILHYIFRLILINYNQKANKDNICEIFKRCHLFKYIKEWEKIQTMFI